MDPQHCLKDSQTLEEKVEQLKDGLANSQNNLGSALQECTSNAACASFLQEFNLQSDLALGIMIDFISYLSFGT
jgi:F0F1-type ATP synthase assembly protein I